MVLARAGLARIGRLEEVTEVLDPLQMLPAPGQGALAVECRAGLPTQTWPPQLAVLDDPATRAATDAERAVLATLEGGCSAPVGALAEVVEGDDGDELWLRAVALSTDGDALGPDVRLRQPRRRRRPRRPAGQGDARRRRRRPRGRPETSPRPARDQHETRPTAQAQTDKVHDA